MSKLLPLHIAHLRAAGYSKNTREDREHLLIRADRALPYGIDQPTCTELEDFLSFDGWSQWTRCTYYGHIAGFYEWASSGRDPHLEFNPAAELVRPKSPEADPDPCTDDELAAALERSPAFWQLAIILGAYAGLRSGEISRLHREHVTEDHITVLHGKGDRSAKLPAHPEIWSRVKDMPAGPLFPKKDDIPGCADLTDRQRRHFNRIGLPQIHLHMFRHWYACMLLRQGVNIRTVQTLMRHKSLQTTAAYLLVVDEQRRLAIRTLPVLTQVQEEIPDEEENPQQEAA